MPDTVDSAAGSTAIPPRPDVLEILAIYHKAVAAAAVAYTRLAGFTREDAETYIELQPLTLAFAIEAVKDDEVAAFIASLPSECDAVHVGSPAARKGDVPSNDVANPLASWRGGRNEH